MSPARLEWNWDSSLLLLRWEGEDEHGTAPQAAEGVYGTSKPGNRDPPLRPSHLPSLPGDMWEGRKVGVAGKAVKCLGGSCWFVNLTSLSSLRPSFEVLI